MNTRLVYLTLIAAFVFLPTAFVDAQSPPALPHVFYGTAEVENGLLPSGYTVTAKANNTVVGTVTLEENGVYGGSGLYDTKLLVCAEQSEQCDSLSGGETITFHTKGFTANESATYQSGEVQKLNLTFPFTAQGAPNTISADDKDIELGSEEAATVNLPTGVNKIELTNETRLNMAAGAIIQNGKKEVSITTSNGKDIDLSNKDDNSGSVSIPSGTKISADEIWDGVIHPPKSVEASGNAPSGFQVGDTVVEVGSPDFTLEFDKAVKIVLEGVNGSVGYKASRSNTWQQITTQCNSATDHSNISSGECYFNQGDNIVIWTYHFTTFAELSPEGGGGSSASSSNVDNTDEESPVIQEGDANSDGVVGILDFNTLMINWDSDDSGNIADFNNDGTVDILDFNLLMVNWNE